MEEINEEDLIMYEESREVKETLWKIWDIINDQKIILKFLLNTSLAKDLKAARTQTQILLDSIDKEKENKIEDKNDKKESEINKPEEDGNYYFFI